MSIDRASSECRGHRRRRLGPTVTVIDEPCREADRGIRYSVQCLRPGRHECRVGAPFCGGELNLLVRTFFVGRKAGWREIAALEGLCYVGRNGARKVDV